MSYMQYLQSLYRGIQIAKPKCCAYAPVSNRQVLLFLDRLDLSIYHASGHPCITASPSHHMTLLQPPSAYIRLGRPPLHSVGQSVRLTARSSARAQLMARFFGYLAARGKSGDSRVSGRLCWWCRQTARAMLRHSWVLHPIPHIDQHPRNAFFLGVVALFEMLRLRLRPRLAVSWRAGCAMSSCSHASLVNSSHVIFHVVDSAEQPTTAIPFARDRWVVLCFVPRAVLLT